MTPEVFVEMVAPHLPIGPYTGIRYSPDCGWPSTRRFKCEIHLSRNDGHGAYFDTADAARLLLGAIAAGYGSMRLMALAGGGGWVAKVGTFTQMEHHAEEEGPIGALRAVLEAWEAYMTPARPRPMMPNPDTEPKR